MNDDFLYRIRAHPPADFARALKERLDRAPKRRARVIQFGIGFLLFGTAFALVSPAIRNTVASWFETSTESTQASANDSATFPPDLTFERDGMPIGPDGEVKETPPQSTSAERAPGPSRSIPSNTIAAPVTGGAPLPPPETATRSTSSDPALDPLSVSALERDFIITGPLMAEPGTAAHAFETRRAVFTLLEWAFRPPMQMLKRQRAWDAEAVGLSATRMEQIAPMIDEAFQFDTRNSNVQTRARDLIWSERDAFRAEIVKMMRAVRQMKAAAEAGQREQAMIYAAGIGQACSRCHQVFRQNGDTGIGARYP